MKKLTGNTYDIKEKIKSAGGKWDAAQKCWMVPDDKFEELNKLVPQKPELYLNGQLWEECPICNQEPVYISLGCICEDCGIKGYRR